MKKVTAYESVDGTLFKTEEAAESHDLFLTISNYINNHPIGEDSFDCDKGVYASAFIEWAKQNKGFLPSLIEYLKTL